MRQQRSRDSSTRCGVGRSLWIFIPNTDAQLYLIDSLADYKALADAYPQENLNQNNPEYSPNWYKISQPPLAFAGVHVTSAAIEEGRLQEKKDYPKFHGWDVESTLWLEWAFSDGTWNEGPLNEGWTLG